MKGNAWIKRRRDGTRWPCLGALAVVLLCGHARGGDAVGEPTLPPAFEKKATLPKPEKGPYQPGKHTMPFIFGRPSATATRKSCAYLRWAAENGQEMDWRAVWRYRFAEALMASGQDEAAFQEFGRILEQPDNTPVSGNAQAHKMDTQKRQAHLCRAILLARNEAPEAARAELALAGVKTGFDRARQAEVLALLGDREALETLLVNVRGNGHPDGDGWGQTFLPLRAGLLARMVGLDDLMPKLVGERVRRGKDAEKFKQWQSSWALMDLMAKRAADQPARTFKDVADGQYSGTAPGFDAPVNVKVTVKGGKATRIQATGNESRPFSALEEVPRRMVEHQSLAVDAITSATVTSAAVIMATDEALAKAKPRK